MHIAVSRAGGLKLKEMDSRLNIHPGIALKILSIGFLAIFCVISCTTPGTYGKGIYENAYTVYQAPDPGPGWKRLIAGDADLAFWNKKLAAFIMVNSTCNGYRDAPVAALANHLFIGIEKKKFIKQDDAPLDGRQAIYSEVEGMMDGAPVRVAAYTLVKNYCTYDLSYSAPLSVFEKGRPAFEKLAGRFKVIKRKRKN